MKIFAFAAIAVGLVAIPHLLSVSHADDELTATRDQAAEQQLKELERTLNNQSLSGNPSAVVNIVAADFLGMDAGVWNGKVHWVPQDKETFADDVVSTSSRLADVTVEDLEARVHGQTGIVRGRAVYKMKDGKVFDTHFLDTWEKRNGRWIQVAAATSSQQTQ